MMHSIVKQTHKTIPIIRSHVSSGWLVPGDISAAPASFGLRQMSENAMSERH
jgi:hypothetical protein